MFYTFSQNNSGGSFNFDESEYAWTYTLDGPNNFEIITPVKPQVGDVLLWKWDQLSFVGEQTITKILDDGRVLLSPGHINGPNMDWYHDPENKANNWTVVRTADSIEQKRKALEEERKNNLELLQEKLSELDTLVEEINELRLKLPA